jgi:predicted nucleic acid-binding protein
VIALTVASDQFHQEAIRLAKQMELAGARMVTTYGVLLEFGNAMSKRRFRNPGLQLLQYLTTDPRIEILTVDAGLVYRGMELFKSRPDKEWGLVDCVSFIVMSDRGLTEALTSDEHFEQAGFVALLRQPAS